jgi:UDP:flavonoid glycosyltransferase YjiC (YdhE family)
MTCEFSSAVAAERLDVPQAQIGIHQSSLTDAADWLIAIATPALDELRTATGLAADPTADVIRRVPVLTCAPRTLEDPSVPSPARVRRFRDTAAVAIDAAPRDRGEPPLIYVSFGSEAPRSHLFPDLYRSTVDALAELPVRALVTIGDRRDPAELGSLPRSVRVERWVAQAALMPHTAAMVGHGGSGSTLIALAAGVPLALIPLFVDGPANARRVAEIGAGIELAGTSGLAGAVERLVGDPRYREAAGRVADELRTLPPVDGAVDDIVATARRRELAA